MEEKKDKCKGFIQSYKLVHLFCHSRIMLLVLYMLDGRTIKSGAIVSEFNHLDVFDCVLLSIIESGVHRAATTITWSSVGVLSDSLDI